MSTDPRFDVPAEIAVRASPAAMAATAANLFEAVGMDAGAAVRAADVLLYADRRGIDSHGVSNMFPYYVDWLTTGFRNPRPEPRVVRDAPAVATIDDDRGLGIATCHAAMDLAIAKAAEVGIGSVSVTNSGHFGAAAYWAHRALDHDMIGVAMTVGGLWVAPTHGARAMVGLNPIALAAPALTQPPFVFDASMSSVAGNKIRILRRLGERVGPGWIARPDGAPIMEPAEVPEDFLMLPLGGTREIGSHKGYGLAVIVDILAGVLSGTGAGFLHPRDVSHHFVAYRIDAFRDLDGFKADLDAALAGLRSCPPAPGEERVLYAGLPEWEVQQDRDAHGIPYHPDVVDWFRRTCAEHGAVCEL
jgi:L-2-hydroxycarboxylate dehydrogenase (NAD+)